MFELTIVAATSGFAYFTISRQKQPTSKEVKVPPKVSKQLKDLWDTAQTSMKNRRYLTAEKALLKILKIDHKNAAAYNRLGILYARQSNYEDAIECFEIASSISPSPSNLHNLGLVYFENDNNEKAAVAFERSLDLEPTLQRFIAFAKAHLNLGNHKKVIDILERATQEYDDEQALRMLQESYNFMNNELGAQETKERIQNLLEKQAKSKSKSKSAKSTKKSKKPPTYKKTARKRR